jgi:ribosomal protein S18 acetylase RimI-like enzyme
MTIVPADTIELAELAALFSAGYAGYYVPVHVDEAAFALMVDAWDIDLRRSCVALDGNERVGVALLGTRGERGWIGGLGVVPGARRTGIGRALMEAVLAGAPADVSLEVIEQNERAIRLYTSLGFERTRILEVWSLTAIPGPRPHARSKRGRLASRGCRGSGRMRRCRPTTSGSRSRALPH